MSNDYNKWLKARDAAKRPVLAALYAKFSNGILAEQ